MEPTPTSNSGTPAPPKETTTPHPLQKFTIFSNLIPELRLKIWTLAIFNNPRIIEILEADSKGYYTPASPPALLSTCLESRAIALEHYRLSFSTESHPGTIYFNSNIDTIFYPSWFWRENDSWPYPTQETKSSIQHVAVEPLEWYGNGSSHEGGDINGFPIIEYPNLKTFYHIIRDCPEMCWCSMGDIQPEKGIITFANVEVCQEDIENPGGMVNDVLREFRKIPEMCPGWNAPVYLRGQMRRNGEEAMYTDGNQYETVEEEQEEEKEEVEEENENEKTEKATSEV